MIEVQILVGDVQKGHLGSDNVIRGHQHIFANNSRWKELQTWAWFHCVRLVKMHRLICNMFCLGQHVTSSDLDLWSSFDLALHGQQAYVSTCLDEWNTMVVKLCS